MKKLILSVFALCCIVMSASALKVYINPGHGGWGSGDRPNATINYAAYDTLDSLNLTPTFGNVFTCAPNCKMQVLA